MRAQLATHQATIAGRQTVQLSPVPGPPPPVEATQISVLQATINKMQCNQPATYPTGADASTQENEMFGINVNKFNDILRTMLPPGTMDEL